jgi:hypothetical protein
MNQIDSGLVYRGPPGPSVITQKRPCKVTSKAAM